MSTVSLRSITFMLALLSISTNCLSIFSRMTCYCHLKLQHRRNSLRVPDMTTKQLKALCYARRLPTRIFIFWEPSGATLAGTEATLRPSRSSLETRRRRQQHCSHTYWTKKTHSRTGTCVLCQKESKRAKRGASVEQTVGTGNTGPLICFDRDRSTSSL